MMRAAVFLVLTILLAACNGSNSGGDIDPSLPEIPSVPAPEAIAYKVTNVYPHDATAFTQGLELYKGKLIEGTGEYQHTKLIISDVKTGKAEKSHTIGDPSVFGEGVTVLNDKLFQLTWQNQRIYEYNIDDIKNPVRTYNWPYEGWGVTNNGNQLIISDGSAQLYFVTPDPEAKQMVIHKTLAVRSNLGLMNNLNELELIDGKVYANRWLTNDILIIDTTSGHVTGIMNFKGIMQQYAPGTILKEGAVLNGIAYDSSTKRILVTGKLWPKLFEIELMNR